MGNARTSCVSNIAAANLIRMRRHILPNTRCNQRGQTAPRTARVLTHFRAAGGFVGTNDILNDGVSYII